MHLETVFSAKDRAGWLTLFRPAELDFHMKDRLVSVHNGSLLETTVALLTAGRVPAVPMSYKIFRDLDAVGYDRSTMAVHAIGEHEASGDVLSHCSALRYNHAGEMYESIGLVYRLGSRTEPHDEVEFEIREMWVWDGDEKGPGATPRDVEQALGVSAFEPIEGAGHGQLGPAAGAGGGSAGGSGLAR